MQASRWAKLREVEYSIWENEEAALKKINCSHDNLASRHAGLNKLDYFAFNLHMFLCADSFANGKREILNIFSPGLRKHNYWFIW